MTLPLMPKATAVWLIDNTSLTFEQVADFTGLHPLEVQGVADGEVAVGLQGVDPISTDQLTADEIKRCEADPAARLQIAETDVPKPKLRTKGQRYTPVSKRHDRPAAILWLLRYHPELSDTQVAKLVGTTKPTINAVRDRTHWNIQQLKPNDPVSLGLCSQQDLDAALQKAREKERRRLERERKDAARNAREKEARAGAATTPQAPEPTPPPEPEPGSAPNLSPPGETGAVETGVGGGLPRGEVAAGEAGSTKPETGPGA